MTTTLLIKELTSKSKIKPLYEKGSWIDRWMKACIKEMKNFKD